MSMGMATSPACQEVTGTGPRPWVEVQTFVSRSMGIGMGKGTTSLLS